MPVITRIPLQAPVETVRNLIENPTFEVDALNWFTGAGTTALAKVARAPIDPIGGAGCLRVTANAAGNQDFGPNAGAFYAAAPGDVMTASLYPTQTQAGRTLLAVMRFCDASGAQIGSATIGAAVPFTLGQRAFVTSPPAPAGTVTARPYFRIVGMNGTGDALRVDQAMLNKGGLVDYVDGNTPEVYTPAYARARWLGTANASASVREIGGAGDSISPALVLAPWTADEESQSILHRLVEAPSAVRLTWRPAGPSEGELDCLFATSALASSARTFMKSSALFSYDGGGRGNQAIGRFCITPGEKLTRGHIEDGSAYVADGGRTKRWHVSVPWTEIPS